MHYCVAELMIRLKMRTPCRYMESWLLTSRRNWTRFDLELTPTRNMLTEDRRTRVLSLTSRYVAMKSAVKPWVLTPDHCTLYRAYVTLSKAAIDMYKRSNIVSLGQQKWNVHVIDVRLKCGIQNEADRTLKHASKSYGEQCLTQTQWDF